MYKWCIDIVLKGSGVIMYCEYDGPESDTQGVFNKLFYGKGTDDVVGLSALGRKSNTFIVVGEIAACDIYQKG